MTAPAIPALTCLGFGEAAQAFALGWRRDGPAPDISAFDIKTDAPGPLREAKRRDYAAHQVRGCDSAAQAAARAGAVFSLVTADRALDAARAVLGHLPAGAYYFDCNSCAPQTKQAAAALLEPQGIRYVDVAVMAPVHPRLHRTPLLVSGPHAEDALALLGALDMQGQLTPGAVGAASSVKLVRSVMVKGLEALAAECLLAGRKLGVADTVLETLDASYPGFGFAERGAYAFDRMMIHGRRRAAEMREAAEMLDRAGLPSRLSRATADWQDQVGGLEQSPEAEGYAARADQLLAALASSDG